MWDTAIDVVLRLAEAPAVRSTWRTCRPSVRSKLSAGQGSWRRHHLRGQPWLPFLSTWEDVERFGPYALSYWVPDEGREAVWQGLRDGTIDMFSSDHAPHTREEKEVGWTQMWSAHTGTPGIQYFYPLALDAVNKGQLTPRSGGRTDGVGALPQVRSRPEEGRPHPRARRGLRHRGHERELDDHERRASCRRSAGPATTAASSPRRSRPHIVRGTEVFANGTVTASPAATGQAGRTPNRCV